MAQGAVLRQVRAGDALALQQACWPDRDLEGIRDYVDRLVKRQARALSWGLVATNHDEIIGFGHLSRWGVRAEIGDLIVRGDYQGHGIGTALITKMAEIASQNGVSELEIGVAESNPRALALYERLGFSHKRRVLLDLGEGPEPVYYLSRKLGKEPAHEK